MPMFERVPERRTGRWELLQSLIAVWYPPVESDAGYSEDEVQAAEARLGMRLPAALREWYLAFGKRREVWSRQDMFLSLGDLDIDEGQLVFYAENQGVTRWGIPVSELTVEDPPVMVDTDHAGGEWLQQSASVSGFALEMLVSALKFSYANCCWANGENNLEALQLIEAYYPRIPFPDWHWPAHPTRFYGDDQVIIETNGHPDGGWLWVAARTEPAFRQFEQCIQPAELEWSASSDDD